MNIKVVLINLIFQKGMQVVDQNLKISLVWPDVPLFVHHIRLHRQPEVE